MTGKQRASLQRLVIVAAAWAAAETLMRTFGLAGLATFAGAALGAAAYFATQGIGAPRRPRGDVIYWRGRAIDPDDWRH